MAKFDLRDVRNRIVERVMLRPGDLQDHPGQWRDHGEMQVRAMVGVLKDVGIADTLKAWRSPRAGGALVTWDGHLRKSLDPDLEWPVDILDITDAEADYLLATHDPITALAGTDIGALNALLESVRTEDKGVAALLQELADHATVANALIPSERTGKPNPRNLPLDVIFCSSPLSNFCCIASRSGWKYGVRSSDLHTSKDGQFIVCPYTKISANHRIAFIDNEFAAYRHDVHARVVAAFRPKYATVRDIMTVRQCRAAKIQHYSLEQVLDWAAELEEYAENVILIPKYDCLDRIPERYVLGYSVYSSYGVTPLPLEAFQGRPVHLLGGSWGRQLACLEVLGEDVKSLDNNNIMKQARFGTYVAPDGSSRGLAGDMGYHGVNPLYAAFTLSVGNIGRAVNQLCGAPVIEEEGGEIADDPRAEG